MSKHEDNQSHDLLDEGSLRSRSISRREFLKIAGIAGATVGLGAGLGGVVAACGGGATTTTTTTAAASTTTTAAASTTTVSAGPEAGREVKLGFVTPKTGMLADFALMDDYCLTRWKEYAADGLVFGDGKLHKVTFEVMDSQSDTNRASQVAGDLITNSKVDMLLAASTPDTVNPVADQAEANGCPCITTDNPMDPYYFGRGATPDKPFKWTYHLFWGSYELKLITLDLWKTVPTNKKVACMWSNDVDGNSRRDFMTPIIKDNGYTLIDGGAYNLGTEDFSAMINTFKKEGCEILTAIANPPDWTNFWKQANQQSFIPKINDISKPTLFSSAMEALGDIGYGLVGPSWWHPSQPYKSTLTGETSAEFALDFEKRTGKQWQQPLEHYVLLEWAVDVLNRTKNLDDKEEIIKNVETTKMADSIVGGFDFTAPVAPETPHQVKNVVATELWEGQWVKGHEQNPWSTKVWPFDLKVVINTAAPDVPVGGKVLSLEEAAK